MASTINITSHAAHEIHVPAGKKQSVERISVEDRVLLENYLMWLHGEALKVLMLVKANRPRPADSIGVITNWGYFRGMEPSSAVDLRCRASEALLD